MAQRIQLRRGTAAAATATNHILAEGELGVETDTGKFKIGDGVTAWNSLGYAGGGGSGGAGIAPFSGPAIIGRVTGTEGDYEILELQDLKDGFGLAVVDSSDVDEVTLTSIATALDSHADTGVDPALDAQQVHGFYPKTVPRANLLGQFVEFYHRPDVEITALPGGVAPAGKIRLLPIFSGANKGLWYQDDAHTFQRIGPLDSFTPINRLTVLGAGSSGVTWTNMPSALTELLGASSNRFPATLWEDDGVTKRYTQARIGINRLTTAGVSGSKLALYYYTGSALAAAGSTAIEVSLTSTGSLLGAWQDIADAVFTRETTATFTEFAIQGSGGDGAIDPVINGLFVDLR